MKKIIVVGSSNTDLVIKTGRIPVPGETVLGGTFMMTPGGKGANQAVAVARLGGDVTFVAKVGDDMFGKLSMEGYAEDRLDITTIIKDSGAASGVALITVDAAGENCIVVAPGANSRLSPADIDGVSGRIAEAEYLLVQLEIPMETIMHAARIAAANGTKVVLNPAPAAELPAELLANTYLITPNKSEGRLLTGVDINGWDDADRAADILISKGVRNVVITLGSRGAYIKGEGIACGVEALRVEATDTTAAGDTFNGALCVALAEGRGLLEAVRFATQAAAISVTRMGAQASIPYRNEIAE